jgi:hypothetical protein
VYLRARWYHPATGTFLGRDPVAGWPNKPYSQHPYQYGYANPISNTDPSGMCPFCVAVIGGAALNAGIEYGMQVWDNHQQGLTGWDAWTNVCAPDIMDAALSGAVAGGTSFLLGPLAGAFTRSGLRGAIGFGMLDGALSGGASQVALNLARGRAWDHDLGRAVFGGTLGGGVGGGITKHRWAQSSQSKRIVHHYLPNNRAQSRIRTQTYLEYKSLRLQGYNASESIELIRQFRSGRNPNNRFLFHFTDETGGLGITESQALRAGPGLRGTGVYFGIIPTPSWLLRHAPTPGWGLKAGKTVRIPLEIHETMTVRYLNIPMKAAIIELDAGDMLPLRSKGTAYE